MSSHSVTRKRSHSLDHGGDSFVEGVSGGGAQSFGTTGFGGRKVHVPGERGGRARSYSDGDMLGERNTPENTFPQHNLVHRHDTHHDLSVNKVSVAEEKSKSFSQRFRFSSMNPLPLMYKAAQRAGRFFKATISGFFSGVTKIVGMKWSTDNQWQQTKKSHFSEPDSERGSLFKVSEEDFLGLPEDQEVRATQKTIQRIKRKEKAPGPIQKVKPLLVGEDDYNPEAEARERQERAIRENIEKHQREAIPLTLSAKEKADLDECLKEARSMSEYQKGNVAIRNPSFSKHADSEAEELSRLRKLIAHIYKAHRPPRPEEDIPQNTSSLSEMKAKRDVFISEMIPDSTVPIVQDAVDPLKPITTDGNQPISDPSIVEL